MLRKNQIARSYFTSAAAAIIALALAPARLCADPSAESNAKLFLHSDWTLQSSCKINATPEQISTVPNSHTGNFLLRYYSQHPETLASRNGSNHAGPQPSTITAARDAIKRPKKKIVAPEKKTGIAKAGAQKPAERTKPKAANRSTIGKTANKTTSKKGAKL